jgi:hypothetical protein
MRRGAGTRNGTGNVQRLLDHSLHTQPDPGVQRTHIRSGFITLAFRSWHLTTSLTLRRGTDEVFPFLADASNLGRITPPIVLPMLRRIFTHRLQTVARLLAPGFPGVIIAPVVVSRAAPDTSRVHSVVAGRLW